MAEGEKEPAADERPVVDESLIDLALSMTPEQRLRHNDRMIRTVMLLRQGLAKQDNPGHG